MVLSGPLLVILLAWCFAGSLGIERLPVVAGLVGPRNAVTLTLAAATIVLVVIAVLARRPRRVLVTLAAALLIGTAASSAVVLARGFGNDAPSNAAGSIRIMSWNINGDLVSPATVARLAARERADIVVLPEITAADTGRQYAPAFAAAGAPMQAFPAIQDQRIETVVFVRPRLGSDYSPTVGHSSVPEKSAVLTPTVTSLPRIVAIHAAQPALRDNPQWQHDLAWVQQQCQNPDTVAVGDFNATLDSFGSTHLGTCTDAASTRSAASTGTWPTTIPTWAAMPLDHVLTGTAWTVNSFTIIRSEDHSGARHRPVLAVITPREAHALTPSHYRGRRRSIQAPCRAGN